MNTNLISKEDNIAKFTVVFTADEFEDAIVDAYKKNKDKFSIDGFRKGKAPRKIIESNYGNDIFYDEALNGLLNKAYPEAVVELDLEVVANPQLEIGEIKKGDEVLVNLPLTVGILGVVIAPWGMILGLVAAAGFNCNVEIFF